MEDEDLLGNHAGHGLDVGGREAGADHAVVVLPAVAIGRCDAVLAGERAEELLDGGVLGVGVRGEDELGGVRVGDDDLRFDKGPHVDVEDSAKVVLLRHDGVDMLGVGEERERGCQLFPDDCVRPDP